MTPEQQKLCRYRCDEIIDHCRIALDHCIELDKMMWETETYLTGNVSDKLRLALFAAKIVREYNERRHIK